jgi:hypothetical protein
MTSSLLIGHGPYASQSMERAVEKEASKTEIGLTKSLVL